jgi:hypothetical protein
MRVVFLRSDWSFELQNVTLKNRRAKRNVHFEWLMVVIRS